MKVRKTTQLERVTWQVPGTVRPGDTIDGYVVHESPGGAQVAVSAEKTTAKFSGLGAGPRESESAGVDVRDAKLNVPLVAEPGDGLGGRYLFIV